MAVGLVDSDSMRRAVWAERLSAWGFPIAWEAATAAEARAAQARHPPSALLVAFELLDGSGAALLDEDPLPDFQQLIEALMGLG
jgi:DNA-binding response OmpR family regulator